jgi:hypothetical protein
MAVQNRTDLTNIAFLREGSALVKEAEVLAQDAGRTGDMVFGTVMAQNPTTKKWVSLTAVTLDTGEQLPQGILMREITEAAIQAGDVADTPILVRGEVIDRGQVVLENSLTLDSVITSANLPLNVTVESWLATNNIYVEYTTDIDGFENS